SKLSGTYQLYAVTFNKYPRPIPTPIENLRPAQETCEQCHWPNQFYSEKALKNTYFMSDEKNTKWTLDLLVKIGGGNSEAGPTSGIHWHMNIANEVTYIPGDSTRQVIPWVSSKHKDGTVTVYRSTESTLSDSALAALPHRRMDCIDCHNRPTHIYHVPARSVNHVMAQGWIDPALPEAKALSVKVLEYPYTSAQKALKNTYFMSDGKNTRWTLDLLVKIGGGNSEAGPTSGIHWHMNIANQVTYIPADSTRQVIPWVSSRHRDGTVTVYRSTDNALSDSALAALPHRRMDCIDCHNRPTHIYHVPARSVNHVMAQGWIDPALPEAKSLSVKVLEYPYTSTRAALDSIGEVVSGFYREKYPAVADSAAPAIARMVEELRKIYSRNYFPSMRVSWKSFPDNIGHMYYPGCFRCHDGKHVSDRGEVLSRDCNMCHTILAQQFQQDTLRLALGGLEYRHPVDIGDAWKETNCSDCHNSN
ncbi:MAG TPA: hypothetical protein VMM80_06670, partial [Bacteroidota bacterium]|nr:hypothetical protein [Bacteroidota bacterium]